VENLFRAKSVIRNHVRHTSIWFYKAGVAHMLMVKIVVYVKPVDPYSMRMLEFLRRKNVSFTKKLITEDDAEAYSEFIEATGQMELPVLVVDGTVIGDYELVTSLDLQGKLDDYFL